MYFVFIWLPENWHHMKILQLVWTFLMPLSSRCKSYFSWILTYMNFYLLTTHNCVKQLYLCMIGSFVNSDKAVWRFNEETFVKQSVKLVPSMKLLLLEFCYQKSEYLVGVYMEMEISYLTRTDRGIKHCYMVYLQGMSHRFEIDVTVYFIIKFEISLVNFKTFLVFCF